MEPTENEIHNGAMNMPAHRDNEAWKKTDWPIIDEHNLIYLDVHAETVLSDMTVHIAHMKADTGIIYDNNTGTYHYVAIIDYPELGDIWHQVVTVPENLIFGEVEWVDGPPDINDGTYRAPTGVGDTDYQTSYERDRAWGIPE